MQWQRLDFPVLVDAWNLLGVQVVPLTIGIDEHGIVRETLRSPAAVAAFLDRTYPGVPADPAAAPLVGTIVRQELETGPAATRPDRLVAQLSSVVRHYPRNAGGHFALGVALRQRCESERRQPGDFQAAVAAWQAALDLNPNQYIWRRRIQQYGPKLSKPYAFYDWVPQAIREVRARGEVPVEPVVPLTESERAERTAFAPLSVLVAPDPDGRVTPDERPLVRIEATVVPATVPAGGHGRLHLALRPDGKAGGHWNNEAGPTRIWLEAPPSWEVERPLSDLPVAAGRAVSDELRQTDVEFRVPEGTAAGGYEVKGYALYYACRGADGACVYLRQEIRGRVRVTGKD